MERSGHYIPRAAARVLALVAVFALLVAGTSCSTETFKPKAVSAVTNADLARTIGEGLAVRGSVFTSDDGTCAGARAVQLFGPARLRDLGIRRGGTQGGIGILALKWNEAERAKLNAAIVDCSDAVTAARKLIAAAAAPVGAPTTTKKPTTSKSSASTSSTTKRSTTVAPTTGKPTISKKAIACVADQVALNPIIAEQVLMAALGSDQESMDRLIADRAAKCLSSGVVEVVVPARGVVPAGSTDVLAEVNE